MTSYDIMRHFADVWGLIAMAAFFVCAVLFIFRPGAKKQYDEAARIPLENEPED